MTISQTDEPTPRKPLRLWPGVAAVVLQWLGFFLIPAVVPDAAIYGLLTGALAGLVFIVWWLFFSRAPWSERVGAIILMVGAVLATKRVVHPSIANAGMGIFVYVFSVPGLSLGLVSWAVASRRLSTGLRRAWLVPAILLGSGLLTLVRTGGITGNARSDFHWRWTPTPEERLLARVNDEPITPPPSTAPAESPKEAVAAKPANEPLDPSTGSGSSRAQSRDDAARGGPTAPTPAPASAKTPGKSDLDSEGASTGPDWPGFRGPQRDGIARGVRIETDWTRSKPVELWRRPIGPGWSSFSVHGNLVYTQEQRGDDEAVSSYNLTTGAPVWMHRDAARFYESNGGPGPRGTPTFSHGRVYSLGATGILNALDARTGAVVWSRNAASDTGAKDPGWGFTSSPLVQNDVVIVAASGRLAAYDVATGHPRWLGPAGGAGYSSPHLATIDGVAQILLMRGARTTSVALADGAMLWEHSGPAGVSIVQPALTADGNILIATNDGMGGGGIRRVAAAHAPGGWSVKERWTSAGLKPYFNDFVVHKGHAFGFDGSILACIDLEDGRRTWKGGRYGNGQLVLLQDQDVLLVLSEDGELALVSAATDKFTELARFPAIQGKTWNHPVLVGDVLLVRNGEEMAAFRLSLAAR